MSEEMTREQARNTLRNAAWLGTDEERELIEKAVELLCGEPCEDAISRQAVLEIAKSSKSNWIDNSVLFKRVNELPPVTPKQRTGHWEYVQYDYYPKLGNWHCSECRCVVVECVNKEEKGGIPLYKYCPQCGAKIQEVEE